MFACQWAEFKFCTILLCTPPHWIWLQFSPLSITHCIGSALQLLFEAVHYITKVKHKKSKLPLARFSWCHMIHFLLPWCLPSWVESISVSVFVSTFVELDKYRNWDEQVCLILDGKDHFPLFSKSFYVFAVWPDTAWKEGIFSGVESSAVIIVCANWSNFFFDRRQQHLKTSLLAQLVVQTSTTTPLLVQLRTRVASTKKGQDRPTTNNNPARWGT